MTKPDDKPAEKTTPPPPPVTKDEVKEDVVEAPVVQYPDVASGAHLRQ